MEKEETQNLSLLQFLVMKGDGLLAFVRTFAKSWEILILSEDQLTYVLNMLMPKYGGYHFEFLMWSRSLDITL